MKKLFSIGLLTVCALALHAHQASAWCNAKFSVGLNWHVQSANNNFLWGFWKNGQVPGPEAFGQPGGGGPGYGPMPGPGFMPPAAQGFQWFGSNPNAYPQGYPQGAPQAYPAAYPQSYPVESTPPQTLAAQQQQMLAYYAALQNYYNPYQAVSYQPNAYHYPNYYAPTYTPSYNYQVPYYWYQGR